MILTSGWKLVAPYSEPLNIGKYGLDGDFAGYITFLPSLFCPMDITSFFHVMFHVGSEQSNFHTMYIDMFHESNLVVNSTLECSYYDCSDHMTGKLWPDPGEPVCSSYGVLYEPWYLLQISEEEYEAWIYETDTYAGRGDMGNFGFVHAFGITSRPGWY